MKIFCYGSNMLSNRLTKRVKSAKADCIAFIRGYDIRFHKRSLDGSGKTDAYFTNKQSDLIWGVIYDINDIEKQILDKAEGLGNGYQEKNVNVINVQGEVISVQIYYASTTHIEDKLTPYDWYKSFVIYGAKENNLPKEYIECIEQIESEVDLDKERSRKNESILNIKR